MNMRKLRETVAILPAMALLGSVAMADELAPGFLAEFPVDKKGAVSGVDIWALPDDDAVWVSIPGTDMIMAGYLFSDTGDDIGAPLIDSTPINAWESVGVEKPAAGAGISMIPDTSPFQDAAPEIANAEPGRAASGAAGSASDDMLAIARGALEEVPDERKRELLIDLVDRMDAASNPVEFRLALIEWNEEVTGRKILDDEERKALHEAASSAPDTQEQAPSAPAKFEPASPSRTIDDLNRAISGDGDGYMPRPEAARDGPDPDVGSDSGDDGAEFLARIEEGTMWFPIGEPDAPAVYMFADPMCPYCARSIQNLRGDVESGNLQLRIILAPLISKRSPGATAAILASDSPGQAFWEHELSYAVNGGSDLGSAEFSELPDGVEEGVKRNYDLIIEEKIPGVPFFAWQADEGAKFLSGVPQAGHFSR